VDIANWTARRFRPVPGATVSACGAAGLARVVADRPLAISVITLGEANGLPLVTLNRRHFEPLTLHGLRLL
jgi:hypothetical protein